MDELARWTTHKEPDDGLAEEPDEEPDGEPVEEPAEDLEHPEAESDG